MEYVQAKDERGENAMMNAEDKEDHLYRTLTDEEPGDNHTFQWFQKPLELMVRMSKGKYKGGGVGRGRDHQGLFMGLGVNNTGIREPVSLKERLNTDRKGVGFRRRKKKKTKKEMKFQKAMNVRACAQTYYIHKMVVGMQL